jgi:beta-lactamase regulating signal transducer with metallopeptidase domain
MVIYKISPILIEQKVYYCKSFLHTITIKIMTYEIKTYLSWITGSILTLIAGKVIFSMIKMRLMKTQLFETMSLEKNYFRLISKHDLQNKVLVYKSTKSEAFCYGLRSPKIYLSSTFLERSTPDELEAILLHEKYHMEQKDSLIMLIASCAQMLFPFFPLINDLIWNYKLKSEIQADNAAIHGTGNKKLVLSVLKKMITFPSAPSLAAPAFADSTLEARIYHLVDHNESGFRLSKKSIAISFFSLAIIAGIFLMPAKTLAFNEQKDDVVVCINGSNCKVWCSTSEQYVNSFSPVQTHKYSPKKM